MKRLKAYIQMRLFMWALSIIVMAPEPFIDALHKTARMLEQEGTILQGKEPPTNAQ